VSLAHRLIGDTVSNDRRDADFYATPDYATDALLANEDFKGSILEPACGDGAIVERLKAAGYMDLSYSDIKDYGYPGTQIQDFLKVRFVTDNIITNPPFDIGTQFTLHALNVAQRKIAIFHKLAFLEGTKRATELFSRRQLETVYVFSRRVGFVIPGQEKHKGGMMAFAWFVWNKEFDGDPKIKWI